MIPGVSVVIVTYRRTSLLSALLVQLTNQSKIPYAVIVVDNDPGQSAREVVDSIAYSHPKISFKYVSNLTNSLTKGRNLGVSEVETEFTCLLDDDVSVNPDFLRITSTYLSSLPSAVGVQGMLQLQTRTKLHNFVYFIKGDFYYSRKSCKVRWSVSASYPGNYFGTDPLECDWISGSNQLYLTEVIKLVKWDEKLIAYCDGEDLDHSLRVSRSKLGSLFLLPEVKVLHHESQESRANGYIQVFMREIYSYYLRKKLFPNNLLAPLFYMWSRFAQILYLLLKYFFSGFAYDSKAEFLMYIETLKIVIKNRRNLLRGDLQVANQVLLTLTQEN